MSNTEKMAEALRNDPELQGKLMAEVERLSEADETVGGAEVLATAAKTVLGIDLAEEDVETLMAEGSELSDEALEDISGGGKSTFKPSEGNYGEGVRRGVVLLSYRFLNKLGIL